MKIFKNLKPAVLYICTAVLLVFAILITTLVGVFDGEIASANASAEEIASTRESEEELALRIEEEGAVLVKNDGCLPLAEEDVLSAGKHRVNLLGWASVDWLMGGSGSGRSVQSQHNLRPATDLIKAFENYKVFGDSGVECNRQLIEAYKAFAPKRADASLDTLNSHDYESCVLYEPKLESYGGALGGARAYSGVAIVVIGRISGESNDAPKVQYKYGQETDESPTYLDISTEEEELLRFAAGTFEKTVVIINSTNAMNLSFLESIEGLNACLVVGGTGNNAANAIPGLLFGKKIAEKKDASGNPTGQTEVVQISPSGKLTDTYAYDFKTNAGYAYSGLDGTTQYTGTDNKLYPLNVKNSSVGNTDNKYAGVSYVDYAEGIYVGYKWYETADAEGFWNGVNNSYGKGYEGVVQYPFGYGLTYSQFDWKVKEWRETEGRISVTLTVKNVGNFPAREVVELYFTPPYDRNGGVEKSAVNLCAFAKTHTPVAPGESRELTLSFDVQDMASYDTAREGGKYVLGKGDYVISLRTDSHTVKKASRATYTYKVGGDVVYDRYNGSNGTERIHNLFTGAGITDGIAIDGSTTETGIAAEWLSRKNFGGTFSEQKAAARAFDEGLKKYNMYSAQLVSEFDGAYTGGAQTFGQGNSLMLTEYGEYTQLAYFYGNPDNFGADSWTALLNQLTEAELNELVTHAYMHEGALNSVGKPETKSIDGPSQIGSFNQPKMGTAYPNPVVLAQSWNEQLARSYGLSIGREAKAIGVDGWYAPGVNLHRSAFGGRNYEYYSEDPYLSGVMCAKSVRGALDAGVYSYIKHFIGYDQESWRDGLYCWLTEQTLREVYLRPYKMAIDEGATGIMSSYGRLGAVWSGGSRALLYDLLRKEWGFKGTVITDYSDHHEYMNGDQMIRAGGDIWMDNYISSGSMKFNKTSEAYRAQLKFAGKHVLYMWTNAAYTASLYDGTSDTVKELSLTEGMHWWWIAVGVADALLIGGAVFFIITAVKKSKA